MTCVLSENMACLRIMSELGSLFNIHLILDYDFAVSRGCLVFRLDDRMATSWSIWWQSRWLKLRADQFMWVDRDR